VTETRPADIVSPITDSALLNRVSATDARNAGRYGHDKPTADNSIVLLVDHQIGLMVGMRDTSSLAELKGNVVGLACVAKARLRRLEPLRGGRGHVAHVDRRR